MKLRRLTTLIALTTFSTLTLAACGTPGQDANTAKDMTPVEDHGSAQPELAETAPGVPDWRDAAPDAGTDAFLVWEALMGPDGEFAALASYQAVLDEFGRVEPYATIMEAEARHAESLIRQLDRMGIEAPENPYLGAIGAPSSLETAAKAWAEGEVLNVELYDNLLSATTDEKLIRVFTNLRRASAEEHLPAFEAAAENGGTLDPSQMTMIRP